MSLQVFIWSYYIQIFQCVQKYCIFLYLNYYISNLTYFAYFIVLIDEYRNLNRSGNLTLKNIYRKNNFFKDMYLNTIYQLNNSQNKNSIYDYRNVSSRLGHLLSYYLYSDCQIVQRLKSLTVLQIVASKYRLFLWFI